MNAITWNSVALQSLVTEITITTRKTFFTYFSGLLSISDEKIILGTKLHPALTNLQHFFHVAAAAEC